MQSGARLFRCSVGILFVFRIVVFGVIHIKHHHSDVDGALLVLVLVIMMKTVVRRFIRSNFSTGRPALSLVRVHNSPGEETFCRPSWRSAVTVRFSALMTAMAMPSCLAVMMSSHTTAVRL